MPRFSNQRAHGCVNQSMNIDWEQLEEFLHSNRQSGSTTAARDAVRANGGVLVAHNEPYAKEIGGVSCQSLRRMRGMPRAPLFFDNGLLIKMCEDTREMRVRIGSQGMKIRGMEQSLLEWESSYDSRVQQAVHNRFKAEGSRLQNALYISHLVANPSLLRNESIEISVLDSQNRGYTPNPNYEWND